MRAPLPLLLLPVLLSAAESLAPTAVTIAGQPVPAVADGDRTTAWTGTAGVPVDLILDLGPAVRLNGLHLHTGPAPGVAQQVTVQAWLQDRWEEIPSATLEGNTAASVALLFDGTFEVTTSRLRLHLVGAPGAAPMVREVTVWPASAGAVPALATAALGKNGKPVLGDDPRIPRLYLNQSGFNLGKPKRFTAPTLADGTPFTVRPARGGAPVTTGVIRGHVGGTKATGHF